MKILLLFPAAVILMCIVSCKKKHTCSCTEVTTITDKYPNGVVNTDTYTSSTSVTAEKQTKKYFRMNNGCYDYTTNSTENNGYTEERTTDVSCTLK